MRFILMIILVVFSTMVFGQYQRTINQSVELSELQRLDENLSGSVTYEEWLGSFILIETRVVVKNGNERIFRNWIKEKRYLAHVEQGEEVVKLYSHPHLGRIEIVNGKQIDESVSILIRYPKGLRDKAGKEIKDTNQVDQVQASGG